MRSLTVSGSPDVAGRTGSNRDVAARRPPDAGGGSDRDVAADDLPGAGEDRDGTSRRGGATPGDVDGAALGGDAGRSSPGEVDGSSLACQASRGDFCDRVREK